MSIALTILLNILIFSAATFGTSVLIEKYYNGRLKWIIVPSFTLFFAILFTKTDFVLKVLNAITKTFTIKDLGLILLGGVITGMFFSFL
jgi:hypothetical protein